MTGRRMSPYERRSVRPPWRQAEPTHDTWREHATDALQIVLGVLVFGTLLLGIFAWMAIATAAA